MYLIIDIVYWSLSANHSCTKYQYYIIINIIIIFIIIIIITIIIIIIIIVIIIINKSSLNNQLKVRAWPPTSGLTFTRPQTIIWPVYGWRVVITSIPQVLVGL